MKLTVDREAGAAYLGLTDGSIVETLDLGQVLVDLDAAGEAVGVEILHCPEGLEITEGLIG